ERIDIHSLMASMLALTGERARKQNLNLEFDCPPDLGTISADERRLKQALFNLISNAIKFTPQGGTIRLAARRQGEEVALVVADNGVGIPTEHQKRVFEKFERGNPQARQSGAGLGLSLVKSFIELHGGRVEMASQPGKGTTVTLHLPADAGESEEAPPGQDQLELAGIARDVADREDARYRGGAGRRVDLDMAALERDAPSGDRAEAGGESEEGEQRGRLGCRAKARPAMDDHDPRRDVGKGERPIDSGVTAAGDDDAFAAEIL